MASTSNTSSGVSTRLSCLPRITGETDEEEIDPNVCCMCFVTFEEDTRKQTRAEWLPCACGRWLHEDCAEDIVVDSDGNELVVHFVYFNSGFKYCVCIVPVKSVITSAVIVIINNF